MRAAAQADPERDGTDVEVFHLHHADGLDDFLSGEGAGH
jgi:hypothetical protein